MADAHFWISALGLQQHTEGGWYRETYRSSDRFPSSVLPARYPGGRPHATAIYFLLDGSTVSRFHRLKSDEIWHFYDGTGLTLHFLHPDGSHTGALLGPRHDKGERFQVLVRRATWMAALVERRDGYALVGCTVAPGFEFHDFELGTRSHLLEVYPQHRELIERLTTP